MWCSCARRGRENVVDRQGLILPRKSSSRHYLFPADRLEASFSCIVVSRSTKAEANNDGDDDLPLSNVDTDDDEDVHVGVSRSSRFLFRLVITQIVSKRVKARQVDKVGPDK